MTRPIRNRLAVLALAAAVSAAPLGAAVEGQEFGSRPLQPDGAIRAMEAVVDGCLERTSRLHFDNAYAIGLRVTLQNLLHVYDTTDVTALANREAKALIIAVCDALRETVPDPEAGSWWDFLKD